MYKLVVVAVILVVVSITIVNFSTHIELIPQSKHYAKTVLISSISLAACSIGVILLWIPEVVIKTMTRIAIAIITLINTILFLFFNYFMPSILSESIQELLDRSKKVFRSF